MNKQQGAVALLVVSVLLVAALMMSLGSYKSLFYQIKRANNQIEARQEHWRAEGGLECAYSNVKTKQISLPVSGAISVMGCLASVSVEKQSGTDYLVSSTDSNLTAFKTILASGSGLGATIKTSASVELTGSMHFVPHAVGELTESTCTSIISGGSVNFISSPSGSDEHFLTVDSSNSSHASGPVGAPSFTCKPTHRSNLYDTSRPPSYPGTGSVKNEDIQEDVTDISVFEDLFSMEYSAANVAKLKQEIREDSKGFVLDASNTLYTPKGWVYGCHTKLSNAYSSGKRRFWVEGSCAISGSIFGTSTQSVENANQLIVHNGLLYTNDMSFFDGLLYQYVPKSSSFNAKEAWIDLFDSSTHIGVTPLSFQKHDIDDEFNKYAFRIDGALKFDGGLGLDAEERTVILNGSLVPAYNGEKSSKYIKKLEWKKGSWNDL
ncbi:hypothetical protein [Vibrio owensii]|uniref:hypothetical protein n=1 Tax=Vibrio owensii TaxID=696485 RepID=UPI0018F11C66|nr:hypothetical protein [Vibrio owensii]